MKKNPIYGDTEHKEARDGTTLGIGSTKMGNGEICYSILTARDCKDQIAMVNDPQAWPNFSTELEVIQILKMCFPEISYFPRMHNKIADSLVRNALSFHRSLCFIGCSIPVWLSRPPQV